MATLPIYEEMVKKLAEKALDEYVYKNKTLREWINIIDNFDFAIDKVTKALLEQTRWIPCSERLPEERDWYLAVFREKDTGFQLIPRVADYRGENTWDIIDNNILVKEYRDILECVAWMPLPEPYRTESE